MIKQRRVLTAHGQLWVTEKTVRDAGYDNVLGELVGIAETQEVYELAARVVPFKVGIEADELVWWLLPVTENDSEEGSHGLL